MKLKNALKIAGILGLTTACSSSNYLTNNSKNNAAPSPESKLKVLNWVNNSFGTYEFRDSLAHLINKNLEEKTNDNFEMMSESGTSRAIYIINNSPATIITYNGNHNLSLNQPRVMKEYKISDKQSKEIIKLNEDDVWNHDEALIVPLEIPLSMIGYDLENARIIERDKKLGVGIYGKKELDDYLDSVNKKESDILFACENLKYDNFRKQLDDLIDNVLFTESKGYYYPAKTKKGKLISKKMFGLESYLLKKTYDDENIWISLDNVLKVIGFNAKDVAKYGVREEDKKIIEPPKITKKEDDNKLDDYDFSISNNKKLGTFLNLGLSQTKYKGMNSMDFFFAVSFIPKEPSTLLAGELGFSYSFSPGAKKIFDLDKKYIDEIIEDYEYFQADVYTRIFNYNMGAELRVVPDKISLYAGVGLAVNFISYEGFYETGLDKYGLPGENFKKTEFKKDLSPDTQDDPDILSYASFEAGLIFYTKGARVSLIGGSGKNKQYARFSVGFKL